MSNQPVDLKTSRELQFHVPVSFQAYEAFRVPAIQKNNINILHEKDIIVTASLEGRS